VVVNLYFLMNIYSWDWLMLLMIALSILLCWFWTGVYTAFTSAAAFYQAAPQVYGQLSFWATLLLVVIICLLPRFAIKSFQKSFMPYDVDVIREQVRQGKFAYLDDLPAGSLPPKPSPTDSSSELSRSPNANTDFNREVQYAQDDDRRPMYPPSVAPTATTHNGGRSQNGSDGTDYTGHRLSTDRLASIAGMAARPISGHLEPMSRPVSIDRARPSYDRMRSSMDALRPSFEASRDMTSASQLSKVESSHSDQPPKRKIGGSNLRQC